MAAGETIAQMGSTSAESVKLHFEIRRNGVPIAPMTLLQAAARVQVIVVILAE